MERVFRKILDKFRAHKFVGAYLNLQLMNLIDGTFVELNECTTWGVKEESWLEVLKFWNVKVKISSGNFGGLFKNFLFEASLSRGKIFWISKLETKKLHFLKLQIILKKKTFNLCSN